METYSCREDDPQVATNVISRLKAAIDKLPTEKCCDALEELREIIMESDISPFEVNYSGLIKALLSFLADHHINYDKEQTCVLLNINVKCAIEIYYFFRLRIFLNVFANCPLEKNTTEFLERIPEYMSALVAKLNGCLSQLEQFPVKVHDFPASSGGSRGGTSALKFFNTHQLKVNLTFTLIGFGSLITLRNEINGHFYVRFILKRCLKWMGLSDWS